MHIITYVCVLFGKFLLINLFYILEENIYRTY